MQNRFTILLILLFIVFFESKAQQHLTAMQAYDKAQQARSNANDLWGKDKASTAEIAKGIKILKNALVFLDSIPIRELAQGNIYLKARSNDIYLDLAQAYAISNQKELALSSLENMFSLGEPSGVVSYIQQDSALNSLRTEPRYLAVINKMTNQGKLWKNTAFKTTYKPDLLEAEKVAGLSLLWSMAKYNFVYFDHLQVDWNQLYMDYLPKVKNTNSTSEYYKVLISFYAQLKDGHTNVYVPNKLSDEFYSRPPFRTELIEGRVFVTQVFSDSLLKSGINPGLEIVKIDAEPVISYAEKNIKPYQSSSTPQDMEVREFTYALLSGPKEKPILFEFRDRNGKIINRTIARTGYRDIRVLKTIEYEEIKNIGYLTINNFEDRNINKDFDSLYTKISKTKGLIIDIRYNGGGDVGIGFNIISKLTDKPFKYATSKVLEHISKPGDEPQWEVNVPDEWKPNGKLCYNKPIVLLIGPRTFSAAEDFTVAFDYMKRGKLVGQPTGGSTGQPVPFDLPGGGKARVCGKRDYYPNGKEFVGVGIIPDITVKETIKDLLNGTDAAKNKAIELLNRN